jgi:hypothetical protein
MITKTSFRSFDLSGCDPRYGAWERQSVFDVFGVCYPPHQALDSKPKAAMWYRAILSEIKIPIIGGRIEPLFLDTLSD